MFTLLLLAAGMSVATPRHARPLPRALDQRVALLEAKEILQSQQIWGVQARLTPEALKALDDVQIHLLRDAEQDDRVRALTAELTSLSQRLATLELLLSGRIPEGNMIPVAPQTPAPQKAKPVAKKRKHPRKRTRKAVASAQ
jgi:hypothetical protein